MLQTRNREINIFNLSMMDVISGAMGAFLIILVLLSRYYDSDPANKEIVTKLEEELRQALKETENAQMTAELQPGEIKDIINKIRDAKYHIKSAQDQVKEIEEKLDQAKSHVDRLEEEKEELQGIVSSLEARRPFILRSTWTCKEGNVDIYLYDDVEAKDNHPMPPFYPDEQQWTFWTGDNYIDAGGVGRGVETWLTLAVYKGAVYKLYYKLDEGKDLAKSCTVTSRIFSRYFDTVDIPQMKLSKDVPWLYVGSFSIDEDRKAGAFKEATEKEREEERKVVYERWEAFKPIQEMRDKRREERGAEDPNAGKKEEKQMTGDQTKKKPFWQFWQK